MFSLRKYCLDFLIFTMIDSKFHFSPTFTSNLFFWTRNRNDIRLKHMTSSTLVNCNSMIISIVMPSHPNVTLFLCYISEHWTAARTLDMTIKHKFPKPDNINPKNHVSIHEFAHRALWFFSTLKIVIISSAKTKLKIVIKFYKWCTFQHSKDLIFSNFRDVFTLKNRSLRSLLGDSKARLIKFKTQHLAEAC